MLKRLTRRDKNNPRIIHTVCENCVVKGSQCTGWECAYVLALRLADYEDTGYSPEQFVALDEVVHWVCTDLPGIYECESCGFPDTQPEFRKRCSNCGTKMRGISYERAK